ncbi:DUF134 domain-containing protein [bacterium]|nr:DUF134 domain-containing protein [bacterium]
MPRPKIRRMVASPPRFSSFKPVGVRRASLERIVLSLDEAEAIKLANFDKLGQQEASEEMGVSRPTFTRLLDSAQQKIADFLINGKELIIEGGNIHFRENFYECLDCGHKFKIDIEIDVKQCPSCGSTNLLDFAGRFGHGRCCRRRGRN